jgi:hypothetical protein
MACEGCQERREKIVKAAHDIIDWIKRPTGRAPFEQLIGPQIPNKSDVKSDQTKK